MIHFVMCLTIGRRQSEIKRSLVLFSLGKIKTCPLRVLFFLFEESGVTLPARGEWHAECSRRRLPRHRHAAGAFSALAAAADSHAGVTPPPRGRGRRVQCTRRRLPRHRRAAGAFSALQPLPEPGAPSLPFLRLSCAWLLPPDTLHFAHASASAEWPQAQESCVLEVAHISTTTH